MLIIDDHKLSAHVVYVDPGGTIYITDHSIKNHEDFNRFVDEKC